MDIGAQISLFTSDLKQNLTTYNLLVFYMFSNFLVKECYFDVDLKTLVIMQKIMKLIQARI